MTVNKSIFMLVAAFFIGGLASAETADLLAMAAQAGFDFHQAFKTQNCRALSAHSAKPEKTEFIEAKADCSSFSLDVEITNPLLGRERESYVNHEVLRVTESYVAGRNPYSGYISSTVQCPAQSNLFKDSFNFNSRRRPFVVGRTNSRHVWGACGKKAVDQWGGLAFLDQTQAFVELKFSSKVPLDRSKFKKDIEKFIGEVKPSAKDSP